MLKNLSLIWKLKRFKKLLDSVPRSCFVSRVVTLETDRSEPYLDVLFIGDAHNRFDDGKRDYWEVRLTITATRFSTCMWYRGYGVSSRSESIGNARSVAGVFYKRWESWEDASNNFKPRVYTLNLQNPGNKERWLIREEMKDIIHNVEYPNIELRRKDGWR